MSEPAPRTSYDEVPYFSRAFSQTHPARLHVIARLCGVEAAPVQTCRLLELGCAAGGNLIPLALTLPAARFVGVDLSRAQVEEGRATIAALGLQNVELRHADLRDVDSSLGTFDYAVTHGVYSWVPRPVQDRLLEVLRERLAPTGVGYVSYNTFPGWRMRSMIRDMMLYHTRPFTDPHTRIRQARGLLDYLAGQVPTEGNPYGLFLRQELEILSRCGDSYLFHEHLEDDNEPLYFHQFVERAEAAGLRYLAEASPSSAAAGLFPEQVRAGLQRGSAEFTRVEQYRDFVHNRLFRSSLLVHREQTLEHTATGADVMGWHADFFGQVLVEEASATDEEGSDGNGEASSEAASSASASSPPEPRRVPAPVGFLPDLRSTAPVAFRSSTGIEVLAKRPATKAALFELGLAWPASLPFEELWRRVEVRLAGGSAPVEPAPERDDLAQDVLELFAQGTLDLSPVPRPAAAAVSERPRASALARLQADQGAAEATNLRHETSCLENYDRQILRLLDGTRTIAEVVEGLVAASLAGKLDVRRDDLPVADAAALRDIFAEVLPLRLDRLRDQALLAE